MKSAYFDLYHLDSFGSMNEYKQTHTKYFGIIIRMAKMKKRATHKCCQGCEAIGTLMNCWWKNKSVRSNCKSF